MDTFLRIDINLYASLLLGFLIIHALSRLDLRNVLNKAFLIGASVMIAGLLFEALSCVLNASSDPRWATLSTFIHVFLFTMAPVLTFVWYKIVIYMVKGDDKISRKRDILMLIPILLQTTAIITSPWTRFFFYVDATNVYHRGSLFITFSAVTYFYVVLGIIYIMMNRTRIRKDDYLMFLIVSVALLIGGTIQTIFYGPLTMWSFGALGAVFVYFLIQDRMVRVDTLTGAWTRESFERHIRYMIERDPEVVFLALYLDVNGLKGINDRFGHHQGDQVLRGLARVVRKSVKIPHVLARMGGDEFILVIKDDNPALLTAISQQIERHIRIDTMASKDFDWDVAMGGGVFSAKEQRFDDFIHDIDQKMYVDKQSFNRK